MRRNKRYDGTQESLENGLGFRKKVESTKKKSKHNGKYDFLKSIKTQALTASQFCKQR